MSKKNKNNKQVEEKVQEKTDEIIETPAEVGEQPIDVPDEPVDEPEIPEEPETPDTEPDVERPEDTVESEEPEASPTPEENTGEGEHKPEATSPEEEQEEKIMAKLDEKDELTEDEALLVMFKYMTGNKGIPGSGVNVTKLVKDTWTIRKPGKPFPGFETAKRVLAKELMQSVK